MTRFGKEKNDSKSTALDKTHSRSSGRTVKRECVRGKAQVTQERYLAGPSCPDKHPLCGGGAVLGSEGGAKEMEGGASC